LGEARGSVKRLEPSGVGSGFFGTEKAAGKPAKSFDGFASGDGEGLAAKGSVNILAEGGVGSGSFLGTENPEKSPKGVPALAVCAGSFAGEENAAGKEKEAGSEA
jgi:hypothetical protein